MTPPRGLAFIATFLFICRGRRCGVAQRSMPQRGIEPHERASSAGWRRSMCAAKRRRPVQPCVITNLWFPVGADSISARAALRNHAIARRGQDPSLRTDHKRVTTLRGVEDAAPYTRPYGGCRGEHCSPVESCVAEKHYGRIWNPPLRQSKFRPRRGQSFSLAGFLGAIAPEP